MSVEARPNFHTAQFVTELAPIVFGEKRVPTFEEIRAAYDESLRGKATPEMQFGLEGFIDSFQVILTDVLKLEDDLEFAKRLLVSLADQINESLDIECSKE